MSLGGHGKTLAPQVIDMTRGSGVPRIALMPN
jgi:hypothetical protein